jgi:MoaA/NifB/PqqE/SkfB family radical SAM enzyme
MAIQKAEGGYIESGWVDQMTRFRPLETIAWEWLRGRIEEIDIELTNDCSLSCVMCPRGKMTRSIGYMDFGLYKKILDEIYPVTINLTGMGEPLLHPEFLDFLEYAKKDKDRFIWVCLYTNGIHLNEDVAKRLIELEVDEVIISLDAATPKTYKEIKGADEFDKVCENISRLLNMKKLLLKNRPLRYNERKPVVALSILKIKDTDQEIEPFFERWDEKDKLRKQLNWRKKEQDIEDLRKKMKEEGTKEEEINQRIGELYHLLNLEWWEEFYKKSVLHLEHVVIGHFSDYCGGSRIDGS